MAGLSWRLIVDEIHITISRFMLTSNQCCHQNLRLTKYIFGASAVLDRKSWVYKVSKIVLFINNWIFNFNQQSKQLANNQIKQWQWQSKLSSWPWLFSLQPLLVVDWVLLKFTILQNNWQWNDSSFAKPIIKSWACLNTNFRLLPRNNLNQCAQITTNSKLLSVAKATRKSCTSPCHSCQKFGLVHLSQFSS